MKRHILPSTILMDSQQEEGDSERQGLLQAQMDDERRAEQRLEKFVLLSPYIFKLMQNTFTYNYTHQIFLFCCFCIYFIK